VSQLTTAQRGEGVQGRDRPPVRLRRGLRPTSRERSEGRQRCGVDLEQLQVVAEAALGAEGTLLLKLTEKGYVVSATAGPLGRACAAGLPPLPACEVRSKGSESPLAVWADTASTDSECLCAMARRGVRSLIVCGGTRDTVWAFLSPDVNGFGTYEQRAAASLGGLIGGRPVMQLPEQAAEEAERLSSLGQMAAGVAHDFNNILANILGHVDYLCQEIEDPAHREALRAIESQASDGADTVRRIKEFAGGGPRGRVERVDLNAVVRKVRAATAGVWKHEAQARGQRIEFVTELGEIGTVLANGGELQDVVMNLVFNALQALPGTGTVEARTWEEDGRVCLSVRDSGVGMEPEVQRRIFEPFFTTKGESGTGLGLSVAHGVITKYGGTIQVVSTPGEGSTLTVRLPRAG